MQEENVNRNHKDTVFRMLFKEKARLLELYNGLNGTDYQDENELEIYTLENAIYMGMKNDVSFLLMFELNLYEHQSTYNPNMPLRNLLYIARQFEKYVQNKSLYSAKRIKLPTPGFVVFYNGRYDQPERCVLKLSDSFAKRTKKPRLELEVLQLNVNAGKNRDLMERCRTLKEYSQYVACVRKHMEREPLAEAVDHAVTECIQEGILREFLLSQRAEVTAMSIFEYDEEEEKRKLRETEYEFGREDGLKEGKEEGLKQGKQEGLKQGKEEGLKQGKQEGLKQGKEEGLKQGKQEGRKEGHKELLSLARELLAQGRRGELNRALTEDGYLDQLLTEFGLDAGWQDAKE